MDNRKRITHTTKPIEPPSIQIPEPRTQSPEHKTLYSGHYFLVLLTEPNLAGDQEPLLAPVTYWHGTYANSKLYTIKICLAPRRKYIRHLARHNGQKVTIAAFLCDGQNELKFLTWHPKQRYVFHVEHTRRWADEPGGRNNPRDYYLCLKPVD